MKSNLLDVRQEYIGALERYLQQGSEAELQDAYRLGRRALAEQMGVLDMIGVHQEALTVLLQGRRSEVTAADVSRAGQFFSESMSAFEMTHRAFGDANAALSRLNQTLEQEIKRIAHALHDEAGQLLAAVHIRLDEAARAATPDVGERLEGVRILLHEIEAELRRLSHELRPTVLDDFGLVPALEFLAEGVSRRTRLQINVEATDRCRLPDHLETALYRIVQEALNNIARHAHATHVRIRMEYGKDAVQCLISDNGVGFDTDKVLNSRAHVGLGLIGIRERLNALGGSIDIKSTPEQGTELLITVPNER